MISVNEQDLSANWQRLLDAKSDLTSGAEPPQPVLDAIAEIDEVLGWFAAICPPCDPTDG